VSPTKSRIEGTDAGAEVMLFGISLDRMLGVLTNAVAWREAAAVVTIAV